MTHARIVPGAAGADRQPPQLPWSVRVWTASRTPGGLGSDAAYGPKDDDSEALKAIHTDWVEDRRFLATRDDMRSPDFARPFHGLQLPRTVIDKIYRANSEQMFPNAWGATRERSLGGDSSTSDE